ncbi:MAG: PQQ-binding-like beta-propeller repeat protein [Anaerolineae bacterium]|nr:PQQ-like beta-propeller repeat protein [Thermoflexales bacterium]MDW8406805.1 PQQ-binding-like beta-propeller repeat protein [Anaerolineae bacterium]
MKSPTPHSSPLRSDSCPNCGAPVNLTDIAPNQTHVRCDHCGSSLALPKRDKPAPPPNPPKEVIVVRPRARSNVPGCLVSLMMLGVFAAAVLIPLWESGALAAWLGIRTSAPLAGLPALLPPARVFGAPYLMPRQDDGPLNVLYLSTSGDQTVVVNYDPAARKENWRSTPMDTSFTEVTLAADAERVYVAHDNTLAALNRSDGATAWEIALAYGLNPQYFCEQGACLQVFGEQVIARLKDGTLMALEGTTGRVLWTLRLNATNGGVFNIAGNPGVVDSLDNKTNAAQFEVFDARTGAIILQIAPRFEGKRSYVSTARVSDVYVLSPDGRFLYVIGGASTAAVWKFDTRNGEQLWLYEESDRSRPALLPFIGQPPYPASNSALFVIESSNDAAVTRLDAQTGAATRILTEDRYEIRAALATDDILVISAQPTFDRSKTELWGVNSETGKREWQIGLKTRHAFDDWTVALHDGRLFLAQTQWEDGRALFDALNLRTGVSAGQVSQTLERADLNGAAFGQGVAWLNIANTLFEVSMADGRILSSWP